ncbi:LLM class flavin-dependent oxidoreductase [Microbispora oryzae]|uniref:LLM class flavin-dependent oxidoreductase n=1 Tax=Microbispora oryzae TaxID=2806554 RepID=UPI0027DABA8E|nr:LLM class flavin-dependent oxidoreductase [Microbispora oryzae]
MAAGTAPAPLSVLELATVGEGITPGEALRHATELAGKAEEWGYHRLWVAEHHGMPGVASSSPAVLIAHLAAATRRIRVGSGGVMLPNHAPLVIAEQFGTLHALHPGRIDLGLGRAPGTDMATANALRREAEVDPDAFPQQVAELTGFLDGAFPPGHPYQALQATPRSDDRPPIWLLGSSGFSARLAGLLGLPFAFAHHFSAENTEPALDLYRSSFRPSGVLDRPYALIGVAALAADTDEEALRQAMPGALSWLRMRLGRPGRVPTPDEAAAYPYTPAEREFVRGRLSNVIHGVPDRVRDGLEELRKRTGADELMITTMTHGGAARLRSYELIARAYGTNA